MAEITIMGAGAFGLSIAFLCAKAGAKVRVLEKDHIGAGSSGGLVGALAPHTPERWNSKKQFQFESLVMAEPFWREVEEISNEATGYGRIGRLQPINTERMLELAQERAEFAKDHWRGKAEWRVVSAAEFGEWAPKSETGLLVHDTLSARMHPRLATRALASAIQKLGGEITLGQDTPPANAKTVIWATGAAGLEALSSEFDAPIGAGEKGQAALLGLSIEGKPQLYANSIHVIPHANGTTAIGSTTERDFNDAGETDDLLDDLLAKTRETFPVLANAPVIERWAGARPRSQTRAPIVGRYPGHDGQFIANGGFKIGFGMAPKLAQCMAELVLEGRDAIPDEFKPERSIPSASA
ncbi:MULTISPECIES: NAD(P)/FAD-dependent oxidoreductase [Halocynthiibacter]|uniref:FAD-binding oxidoreductase n=1 Tax=Halocynthiibacter halioticoli TaxID=2986804 RepID=A0AAE3J126_9RHOB|nr:MULTISPECIES: FAD-binding oxidoreductase [Halocynthiibacter]MCV6823277.1 FAD-binding oxidoreductase [Halocynthiibacter halioticoli]MCW4056278.1 FAD-binding oxidoreductase [Halocynthiibacter sp. SDUM655004]